MVEFFRKKLKELAHFVEQLESRHDGEKAFFAGALATGVHVFLTVSFFFLYVFPPKNLSETRDLAYGWIMAKVLMAGMVLYLIILVLVRWTYTHPRWRTPIIYFLFQTVGTVQFSIVQSLGTFSTAMMIVYPADVAFVFLLFDEKKALFVLLYGGFLFTCIGILEHLRILSYAPLLSEAIRPVPPPLFPLFQEIFFIWAFTGLLYSILFYVHYSLRNAHRNLREAKDQLVRSESLAAVGSLVTGAAHELRNPLSSSGGLLQSILEDFRDHPPQSPEERAEAVKTLEMALQEQRRAKAIVDRLYRLTDDLTQSSSVGRLSTLLDNLARKHPSVEISCPGVNFSMTVRAQALETVLSNLIDNALASGSKSPPALAVSLQNGHTVFSVSDDGKGIPASIHAEVFKPFYTGQKAGKGHGVGLGLYIVHELVTRLGGTVALQSEEGRGTKVTVSVPKGEAS